MALAKKTESFSEDMLSDKMKQTLASLRLENIKITDEVIQDVFLYDQGKISLEEFRLRGLKRIQERNKDA